MSSDEGIRKYLERQKDENYKLPEKKIKKINFSMFQNEKKRKKEEIEENKKKERERNRIVKIFKLQK